jgi:hypothetical protein
MTSRLAGVLKTYREGLERELLLLDALARLASSQRVASVDHDAVRLDALTLEREDLVQELLRLDDDLRLQRAELAAELDCARTLDLFEGVSDLHRRAAELLDAVLGSDRETCATLERDSEPRRLVAHELEAGGATLAAYRKVLSPVAPRSGIFDRRG